MIDGGERSLMFLDVDGPLIPFGASNRELPDGYPVYGAATSGANPLLRRLNPALGVGLAALDCDLVWATSWTDDANDAVAPLLGLPQLPVVFWPEQSDEDDDGGLHWKTRVLVEWAAERCFVWVDDEISNTDRVWVARRHAGKALLHRVDPRFGLTDRDFAVVTEWLRNKGPAKWQP